MKRNLYKALVDWKDKKDRKPLILRGARQVGKTYLLKLFAKENFDNFIYANFEERKDLKSLFEAQLEPKALLDALSILYETQINPKKTLIIFDEIQDCPNALNSLKYFNEKAKDYPVVAAGSLLGVKLGKERGFPVGQVQFLDLFPLTFSEFLGALGHDAINNFLNNVQLKESIPEAIHQQVLSLLSIYLVVGGMPEVVKIYRDTKDLSQVRSLQNALLQGYVSDFAKYATPSEAVKISNIWESIPAQLAKENKKFIFKVVKEGVRAREYESALIWLMDAGLVHKLENVETPKVPLITHKIRSNFKIYFMDVGLLSAFCNIDPALTLKNDQLLIEFKGVLAENFVLQELIAHEKRSLAYWTSEGTAEVDFVLEYHSQIFPLEVKAGIDKRKKSLQVYADKYHPKILSRATGRNLKLDGQLLNYPIYLVGRFPEIS